MYDPLALDVQRITQERLRRRTERAFQRPARRRGAARTARPSRRGTRLQWAFAGLTPHRAPRPCVDC